MSQKEQPDKIKRLAEWAGIIGGVTAFYTFVIATRLHTSIQENVDPKWQFWASVLIGLSISVYALGLYRKILALNRETSELNGEIDHQKTEAARLEKSISESKAETIRLRSKIFDQESETANLRKDIGKSEAVVTSLRSEVSRTAIVNATLHEEITRSTTDSVRQQAEITHSREEADKLRSDIAELLSAPRISTDDQYIDFDQFDSDRLVTIAAEMLDASNEECHYFGAIGLINTPENTLWQDTLIEKLKTASFRFTRIVNLQRPSQFAATYKGNQSLLEKTLGQYWGWLDVHRRHLDAISDPHVADSNKIYHFEGAPTWQRGFHVIVFDRQHLLIAFRSDNNVRAQLLKNKTKLCSDAIRMMGNLIGEFKLTQEGKDDLVARMAEIDSYVKEANISINKKEPWHYTGGKDKSGEESNQQELPPNEF